MSFKSKETFKGRGFLRFLKTPWGWTQLNYMASLTELAV